MKNKEIIIDGVDVSKCCRFARKTGYCEGAFKPEELPFCESFDCDFKRLKHKERECYNYKQALDKIEGYLNTQLDEFGNDVYFMDKSAINRIQNIIDKAKDGE